MADIKYEIVKQFGALSESASGWKKELNLISWNGAAPKYDIRDWSPDHEKMGKGTTLTESEISALYQLILDKTDVIDQPLYSDTVREGINHAAQHVLSKIEAFASPVENIVHREHIGEMIKAELSLFVLYLYAGSVKFTTCL